MDRKPATEATRRAQAAAAATLPKDDGADVADARRGFIATLEDGRIAAPDGRVVWDMSAFAFEKEGETCPDTIHPSLWRQARLNLIHGLFEVTPGIFQVRGFDLSNITFVEGETGVIVIDPLISSETAAAALALYRAHRGARPVTAVIYTHSHVDHYGGIGGVASAEDLASGLAIIAPEGFLQAAVSENLLAGNAMNRRATYMYGALLPRGPQGHVDAGLGKGVSVGEVRLVPPTRSVRATGERMVVDGVEIVFQVTPDTEAPAEMNFYFPAQRALCMAENCTCHLHNLYTPRGAQVRDAKAWSFYIDEAIALFAGEAEAMFASHHWPKWGAGRIAPFLTQQRDLYKFIHDQTLRLANHGLTPTEIAEDLRLPPSLAAEWHTRGYYGTLSHNTKAVYQRYLGWFDGNPAHLHPHPPEAAARRYVDLAGGAEALIAKGREAFEAGDYRWVAELTNHLVFADPGHEAARALQADALEQMGYQAESGPWRSFFLTGAQELRHPMPAAAAPRQGAAAQMLALPADALLDALSVRLNGEKAAAATPRLNLRFTDLDATFGVFVENAVLHHRPDALAGAPTASLTRKTLVSLVRGETDLAAAIAAGEAVTDGSDQPLAELLTLLDRFDFWFNIVRP